MKRSVILSILSIVIILNLMTNCLSSSKPGVGAPSIMQNSYATTSFPFLVQQVTLWANATNSSGLAWGAVGILNNGTNNINVTGIIVNGKSIPRQNWYFDANQTDVSLDNLNSTYVITSMNYTGFLNESAALSPNVCAASPSILRIDFDGAGPKPALCLHQSTIKPIPLPSGSGTIIYFRIPNGQILPSTIGSHLNVNVIATTSDLTTYKTSQKVIVNSLNRFNLRFFLHTNQSHYSDILAVFAKHLRSGDILMIGGDNNSNTTIAVAAAKAAQPLFAPGVTIASYRIYHTLGNITAQVPTLHRGYNYILYDYEIWNSPEFTTNQTQSVIYFDQANAVIQKYNQDTGSHARLMVAISYWPIKAKHAFWNWGEVSRHTKQLDVMMSGFTSNPCLASCSSSVYAPMATKSPKTVNEIQLSFAKGRDGPEKVASALYELQGVGVNNTLVFYDNYQTQNLKQFFNLLHYSTYWK